MGSGLAREGPVRVVDGPRVLELRFRLSAAPAWAGRR